MSIGSWDPDAGAANDSTDIDVTLLERFIAISRAGQLPQLEEVNLSQDSLSPLMQLESAPWLAVAAGLSEEDLRHLIQFFAVAENLPGCEAGDKSPVIPLAKTLRQRGHKLDREFLLWLRQVNNNRFLPYGPL